MAAASGPPQDTTKTKTPITPEQKKLYTQLGVIGVLILIAGGIYVPKMLSGGGSADPLPVAPSVGTGVTPGSVPPGAAPVPSGAGAPAPDAATPGTGAATTAPVAGAQMAAQPMMRSRIDPFEPIYFIPTPVPPPPPVPPPINLPSPGDVLHPALLLPGPQNSSTTGRALVLPPVSIQRLDESARRPTETYPPRRTLTGEGGSGLPTPSFDKRLSGVIIGDGVTAALEIQGPSGTVTRFVKPGDEVDGITVLNIQRFNDGTRTVTRMLIRENGEEKTVDLRASPNPIAAPGVAGLPGAPGAPGGP